MFTGSATHFTQKRKETGRDRKFIEDKSKKWKEKYKTGGSSKGSVSRMIPGLKHSYRKQRNKITKFVTSN